MQALPFDPMYEHLHLNIDFDLYRHRSLYSHLPSHPTTNQEKRGNRCNRDNLGNSRIPRDSHDGTWICHDSFGTVRNFLPGGLEFSTGPDHLWAVSPDSTICPTISDNGVLLFEDLSRPGIQDGTRGIRICTETECDPETSADE